MELSNKDILGEYWRFFRVECNARVSLIPGNDMDMPFYIYDGAHKAARHDAFVELKLEDEKYYDLFDRVYAYFTEKLKETDHFADSDEMTVEAIENGQFD